MTPRRIVPLLLAAACTSAPEGPPPEFPSNFMWGAAVAGFQVDMGCPTVPAEECEDRASDWYQWITDERLLEKKEALHFVGGPPSTGPGFYELYPQDLARAKNELGLGTVRVSIEWSRLFPTSTEAVAADYEALKEVANPEGVAFYHRLFTDMKAKGLVPLVTLNHYTLPLWIHDGAACHFDLDNCEKRGWVDDTLLDEAYKYALFAGREYGAEVDWWATLNEPLANTLAGYLSPGKDRVHPPGLGFRAKEAKAVTFNMIRGHARMYDGLKDGDTVDLDGDGKSSMVGVVLNLAAIRPADPDDPDDEIGADNIRYLYNELFAKAVIDGYLDENASGEPGELKPELKGRCDYMGVNYYTRITVDGTVGSILPEFSPLLTLNVVSPETVLYEDHPRGLYQVLKEFHAKWKLPVLVTENGYARPDDQPGAEKLLVETISWMKKAIDEGVDVRGYYYWSLTDNYEWNHGMEPMRFGLYAVDTNDVAKPRTRRPFADAYASIVAANKVPEALADKHPIE